MLVAVVLSFSHAVDAQARESPSTIQPTVSTAATPPPPIVSSYRIRKGAVIDLGWTGISHRQPWPSGQRLDFELRCARGNTRCPAQAGAADALFGPPVPLSSGGIPVCVVNRLREAVTGSFEVKTGCGILTMRLASTVILAQDTARPCPICAKDRTPGDGKKDGKCEGGAADGAACDAEGESAAFGWTSSDCQPLGATIGTLPIDLDPLTTNLASRQAHEKCTDQHATARCFCAGQTSPNPCHTGYCAHEKCVTGPQDGFCGRAPFRSCLPGSGTKDCEARFPGSGSCEGGPRPCFSEKIDAQGLCHPAAPTFVATFCVPATASTALNTSSGLPGPARLSLPLERIETAGAAPTGKERRKRPKKR